MLQCFHYEGCSAEEATKKWKITPKTIDASENYSLKTIFNKTHTDCFGLDELDLDGEFELKGNGTFYVAVIYAGQGKITCGGIDYFYSQGDEIFFPAAIEKTLWKSTIASKILLCYPPK